MSRVSASRTPRPTFGNHSWLRLLHPPPRQAHQPSRSPPLCVPQGVLLPCPCCLRFGAQPPHSLSCCSNLSGPSAASVCASPTCAPGRCQRTLSGKACPIAEFPCPKCSVCRLSPTQKRPGLARADSLSPGSAGPPPGALHSALSSPVPCPSLCPPSGRFCFPLSGLTPADLSVLSLNGTDLKDTCVHLLCARRWSKGFM